MRAATRRTNRPGSGIAVPGRRLRPGMNYRPDIVDQEMAGQVAVRLRKIFEAMAADPTSLCKDVTTG